MNAREKLSQRCGANTTQLFKQFLRIIEDLKFDHDEAFRKLRENMPVEYLPLLNVGNYFDGNKMALLRKRILDMGNEAIRTSDTEMEEFTVSFAFKG